MATPTCPLLGDGVTDDTLLHIARFLPTAKDLLRLQLTNKRFSTKCIAAPSVGGAGGGSASVWASVWASVSGGEAVDCGGGSEAVGGGLQRAGARLGASPRA